MISRRQLPPHALRVSLWLLSLVACDAEAQVVVMTSGPVPMVFGGGSRPISLRVHNPTARDLTVDLRFAVFEAASATAMPVSEPQPWKRLHVLAGQTVLESAVVPFPSVVAEARFLLRWVNEQGTALGVVSVLVYPTNLLRELKPLAGGDSIGLYDPLNQLKPLLAPGEAIDLEREEFARFTGKLAVLGPFASWEQMPAGLERTIRARAKTGINVIWIQPPARRLPALEPATLLLRIGGGAVVVAQAHVVSNLPQNPLAQLNLVQLARLASRREPLDLPNLLP